MLTFARRALGFLNPVKITDLKLLAIIFFCSTKCKYLLLMWKTCPERFVWMLRVHRRACQGVGNMLQLRVTSLPFYNKLKKLETALFWISPNFNTQDGQTTTLLFPVMPACHQWHKPLGYLLCTVWSLAVFVTLSCWGAYWSPPPQVMAPATVNLPQRGAGSGWSDWLPLSLPEEVSGLVLYHLYSCSSRLDGFSRWQQCLLASCY